MKSAWLAASLAGFELTSTREGVLPKSHVSSMSVLNSTQKRSGTQLGTRVRAQTQTEKTRSI